MQREEVNMSSNTIPNIATAQPAPSRSESAKPAGKSGDSGFGEALAGAQTVLDSHESKTNSNNGNDKQVGNAGNFHSKGAEHANEHSRAAEQSDDGTGDVDATDSTPTPTAGETDSTDTEETDTTDSDALATPVADAAPADPQAVPASTTPVAPIAVQALVEAQAATTVDPDTVTPIQDGADVIEPTPVVTTTAATTATTTEATTTTATATATAEASTDAEAPVTATTEEVASTEAASPKATTQETKRGPRSEHASAKAVEASTKGQEVDASDNAEAGAKGLQIASTKPAAGPNPNIESQTETPTSLAVQGQVQAAAAEAESTTPVVTDTPVEDAPETSQTPVAEAPTEGESDADANAKGGDKGTALPGSANGESHRSERATERLQVIADRKEAKDASTPTDTDGPTLPTPANDKAQAAVDQARAAAPVEASPAQQAATPTKSDSASTPTQPATATSATGTQQTGGNARTSGLPNAAQMHLSEERIENIANQMSARMRLSQAAGGTQVHLALRPRELGDVHVSLSVQNGHVTAHVAVDRTETGRLLQLSSDDLKRALNQSGLNVQHFSVDVRDQGGASAWAHSNGGSDRSSTNGRATSVVGALDASDDVVGATDNVVDLHEGNVSVLA
jgi:hypothetical protein